MASHCRAACGCPPLSAGAPVADASCQDRDKSGACAQWAASGECTNNPPYMKIKCAATCNTCDMLDYNKRCPADPDAKPSVPPGAMRETFEMALSNYPRVFESIFEL